MCDFGSANKAGIFGVIEKVVVGKVVWKVLLCGICRFRAHHCIQLTGVCFRYV